MHKQYSSITLFLILSLILASCGKKHEGKIFEQKGQMDIIMHAGGVTIDSIAPENSLDAIELTARVGATMIELDFQVTADDQIIMIHDDSINHKFRNANDYSKLDKFVACNSLTLEEIREKYVFEAKNPAMRQPIATLEEALIMCRNHGIYPYIEMKAETFTPKMAKKAYQTAVRIMGRNNFAMTSFEIELIKQVRKLDKEVELCCDMIGSPNTLAKYRLTYFAGYEYHQNDQTIELQHREGLRSVFWTVPKENMDWLLERHIEGVVTDDIAPNYNKASAIFEDYSDGRFSAYTTTGTIKDNILHLQKGETIVLSTNEMLNEQLYLGGMYFRVSAIGNIKIEAQGFDVERKNSDALIYKDYNFQYLFHNQQPYFRITALDDNVSIKSIWLAVCNF